MRSEPTRREIILTGGATTVAGLAGCSSPLSTSTPKSDADTGDGTPTADEPADYTEIYEATIDSVVRIETDGQGTGFMYDDQHIVTNAHVVGTAQSARVRFTEGRWNTGEVVGVDPHSDLAVLTVDDVPEAASPLSFADADPEVGQRVLAIGNPYNLNGTMTSGIISGVDRSIPSPAGFEIPDAIQTDAPVNPGNSGGPLVDLDGDVVAVINSGGGDNIGFGISAALTQRVVPKLLATGDYDHLRGRDANGRPGQRPASRPWAPRRRCRTRRPERRSATAKQRDHDRRRRACPRRRRRDPCGRRQGDRNERGVGELSGLRDQPR